MPLIDGRVEVKRSFQVLNQARHRLLQLLGRGRETRAGVGA